MKFTTLGKEPLPPHLGLDDYADFVALSIQQSDRAKVAKQKKIEKTFSKAFSINPENSN
jgi:hypothetical protein